MIYLPAKCSSAVAGNSRLSFGLSTFLFLALLNSCFDLGMMLTIDVGWLASWVQVTIVLIGKV